MSHPNVVNVEGLTWEHRKNGADFEVWRKALGQQAGGHKLGCSLYRQPPGKKAFPYHHHFAIEEAIYVLSGTAELRIGGETVQLGPGDYVALPTGREHAHQIANPGADELVYLCFSTMDDPDVVGYPDSDKVGVVSGYARGGPDSDRRLISFFPKGAAVPYWTGEAEEE